MKITIGVLAVVLELSVAVLAQTLNRSRGQGYVFIVPYVSREYGSPGSASYIGAGGEGLLYKGIGLGVELGPVFRWSDFNDSVFALGSANVSYHFLPSTTERRLEPFVTAGYSIFARAGVQNGSNAGGGVNIWLKQNVGLRFEIREYGGYAVRVRYMAPRIGLTFR